MKTAELMSCRVATCRPEDSLDRAAELMWNRDCGWIPVVDTGDRPIGVITDRDICMAAWIRGAQLGDIEVSAVMARHVVTCATTDSIDEAHGKLRDGKLHRLAVIDEDGKLAGALSLADLTQAAGALAASKRGKAAKEILDTACAVTEPRTAPERIHVLPAAPTQASTKPTKAPAQTAAKKPATKKPATKKAAAKTGAHARKGSRRAAKR